MADKIYSMWDLGPTGRKELGIKAKKYADLTDLQNDTLERWTKQACRDYPDADKWWMQSIAYYCLMKPEEAKKYAEENQDKLYQTRATQNACWERIERENPHVKRIN